MLAVATRAPPRPLVCRCDPPAPVPVLLWGWVPIEGADQCRRCGRKVVT